MRFQYMCRQNIQRAKSICFLGYISIRILCKHTYMKKAHFFFEREEITTEREKKRIKIEYKRQYPYFYFNEKGKISHSKFIGSF